MNLENIFAVLLLSLVVLRPTLTFGADPVWFIQKICTKGTTCPIYKLEDPTIYSSICIKFMSPFAAEIASDLGRAALKSVELEISSTEYLKKFKPPPGTSAYMLKRIQMAINCVH
ncbi:hypothetical protein V5N11_012656 [Cardamine amara subsp. amara]|uniref:Uncharacterized protein n=1 Tax=Cardamine amara subsp. amara TaxID=228776 RepID=A0ABD0Z5A6_CARAN